jgi:hypothetical protein
MRLVRYINENEVFELWKEQIKNDCSFYWENVRSAEKRALYRGIRGAHQSFIKKEVRQDRKPLATRNELHFAADESFERVFGFKARSQAIFATGLTSDAEYYGNVYIIFPIGKFQFVWSKKIGDLYGNFMKRKFDKTPDDPGQYTFTNMEPKYTEKERKLKETDPFKWETTVMLKHLDKQVKKLYQTNDLPSAIWSHNEIMIHCKSYYAVSAEFALKQFKIKSMIEVAAKKMIEEIFY